MRETNQSLGPTPSICSLLGHNPQNHCSNRKPSPPNHNDLCGLDTTRDKTPKARSYFPPSSLNSSPSGDTNSKKEAKSIRTKSLHHYMLHGLSPSRLDSSWFLHAQHCRPIVKARSRPPPNYLPTPCWRFHLSSMAPSLMPTSGSGRRRHSPLVGQGPRSHPVVG